MTPRKEVNALLSLSITINCPNEECEHEIDLLDNADGLSDDGYIYNRALSDKGWGCENFNEKIECPKCKQKIMIKNIIY